VTAARPKWRWLVGGIAGLMLVALITMTMTYVFPREDTPARADAIIVLGGLRSAPVIEEAQRLAAAGHSDRIVISDAFGGDTRPANLCRTVVEPEITCFTPRPGTTAGEAHAIGGLAAEEDWDTLIIVTADYHVSRARVILEQCFTGTLLVVGATVPLGVDGWLYQYLYQTAGLIKSAIEPAC
jgi:uncharacterized SAM-binding protein YcdF (DUF218 family)